MDRVGYVSLAIYFSSYYLLWNKRVGLLKAAVISLLIAVSGAIIIEFLIFVVGRD